MSNNPPASLGPGPSKSSNKKRKGILKRTPGFQTPANILQNDAITAGSEASAHQKAKSKKAAHYDEMNIIATLHPPDKDYGHMKVTEPDTPYNYDYTGTEEDSQGVNPDEVAIKIRALSAKKRADNIPSSQSVGGSPSIDTDDNLTEEERKKRKEFEARRKAHYNEYAAVLERKNRRVAGSTDSLDSN
ncbi:unnamed protein product [Allacma fusca]|uniref:Protein phosphatase inhibitor 2 n=1 Tax=Allacma fusca TaxID=39272 RepID=A0A8J2Q6B0_9HEXA|nr:unnamed protein product [Allacma fusca]